MEFVARRVGHRADFFDLLWRVVALRNEKDRKNQPVSHRRSNLIHNPTVSWMRDVHHVILRLSFLVQ